MTDRVPPWDIDPQWPTGRAGPAIDAIEWGDDEPIQAVEEYARHAAKELEQIAQRLKQVRLASYRSDGTITITEEFEQQFRDEMLMWDVSGFLDSLVRAITGEAEGHKILWRRTTDGRPPIPEGERFDRGMEVAAYVEQRRELDSMKQEAAIADATAKFGMSRSEIFKWLRAYRLERDGQS